MKKLTILLLFLLPIFISSFKKTTFLFDNKDKNIIVHVKDLDLYLDLNDYITGVVSAEMPALFEEEALKAQAIASRSYAASNINNTLIEITSTTNDQAYYPNYKLKEKWQDEYRKYSLKIKESVESTNNLVIKRDNKILKTYYFSMSNGYTESSQTVFKENTFESVISPEDETNKNYKVVKTISKEELKKIFNNEKIVIGDITRNDTNHIDKIVINNKEYTGIEIRKLLNLRSTDFTIKEIDDNYEITTIGYGHGVGMSEYGANYMAKQGSNYKEILKHYYQNTEISEI